MQSAQINLYLTRSSEKRDNFVSEVKCKKNVAEGALWLRATALGLGAALPIHLGASFLAEV